MVWFMVVVLSVAVVAADVCRLVMGLRVEL